MRLATKSRLCKYCHTDLSLWGKERENNVCPDCASKLRDVMVQCSGRCKQKFAIRSLEKVTFYFNPGKKGGKKMSLYVCPRCLSVMRSRADGIQAQQEDAVAKAEERLMRKVKGG